MNILDGKYIHFSYKCQINLTWKKHFPKTALTDMLGILNDPEWPQAKFASQDSWFLTGRPGLPLFNVAESAKRSELDSCCSWMPQRTCIGKHRTTQCFT